MESLDKAMTIIVVSILSLAAVIAIVAIYNTHVTDRKAIEAGLVQVVENDRVIWTLPQD